MESSVRWRRIGPVFLDWSEDPDSGARVIGWGGSDLYHCDTHVEWAGEYDEALDHAREHGFYLTATVFSASNTPESVP